jgi:hypothetical protein
MPRVLVDLAVRRDEPTSAGPLGHYYVRTERELQFHGRAPSWARTSRA